VLVTRACREIMWVPTGTLPATEFNDAAFRMERLNSIVSGVTQVESSTTLWVPSGFVTMLRQPAMTAS
jgi:hypothetical protein